MQNYYITTTVIAYIYIIISFFFFNSVLNYIERKKIYEMNLIYQHKILILIICFFWLPILIFQIIDLIVSYIKKYFFSV